MEQDKAELDRLVGRLQQLQTAKGLTHTQFAARYAKHVGSHKTWEDRLVARDFAALKMANWLPRLRRFVAELDGASTDLDIFTSLPIVKHAEIVFDALQEQRNDRRCAMLIGVQGTGKTLAMRHLARANESNTVFLSANETWKESRMRIATALARAVNATQVSSASQTFQNALDALKSGPINLLIDEAHEGGVLLMKLVKTIINETRSRVMLAQYPTSWRRLTNGANDAYAEAQQLLRRTYRPVKSDWMGGINEKDLLAWAKAVELPKLGSLASEILPKVRTHGNYSLLSDALDRATLIAGEPDSPWDGVTPELFKRQIDELCGTNN